MSVEKRAGYCVKNVYHSLGNFGQFHQCRRKATVGSYCFQHDPERVAAKRKTERDAWNKAERASRAIEAEGTALAARLKVAGQSVYGRDSFTRYLVMPYAAAAALVVELEQYRKGTQ